MTVVVAVVVLAAAAAGWAALLAEAAHAVGHVPGIEYP